MPTLRQKGLSMKKFFDLVFSALKRRVSFLDRMTVEVLSGVFVLCFWAGFVLIDPAPPYDLVGFVVGLVLFFAWIVFSVLWIIRREKRHEQLTIPPEPLEQDWSVPLPESREFTPPPDNAQVQTIPDRKKRRINVWRILTVVVVVLFLFLLFWAAYETNAPTTKTPSQTTETETTKQGVVKASPTSAAEEKVEGPSDLGVGLAIFLLVAGVVVVIVMSWTGWKTAISQPAIAALVGVIVLNCLLYMSVYMWWKWFSGHPSLFWETNLGIILFVFFVTKTGPVKYISYPIGALILLGLGTTIYGDQKRGGLSEDDYSKKMVMEEPLRREVVLRAIAMAESGGQHFNPDGTVKRGFIDPDDTGMFQINKRVHADLIKQTGLDPEKEGDNIKLANILYEKYGTAPWNSSRDKWREELKRLSPRLARPFTLAIVEVPSGEWSEEIFSPLLSGTNIIWERLDRMKGGKCEVMLDKDPQKVFPVTETHLEFSSRIMQFRCTEPPTQIRVSVVPSI